MSMAEKVEEYFQSEVGFDAEDLARVALRGCAIPGCTHHHEDSPLFLHASCHPEAGLSVAAYKGSILVFCKRCHKFVTKVNAAPRKVV
jgi:hypothetical protein